MRLEPFIWCKEYHYFRLSDQRCPSSGWHNPFCPDLESYYRRIPEPSYDALIEHRADEPHLLNTLLVAGRTATVVGGFMGNTRAAPAELVEAVEDRNRLILDASRAGWLMVGFEDQRRALEEKNEQIRQEHHALIPPGHLRFIEIHGTEVWIPH